ncbi:carboxymethylenebutenolidase [Panacagrimonas perspica]|uniref:Carboxymethylenebutenolidase n=1 Tax=Panacagrimonas perspica TaxID=381431 RepID=A0A4R7PC81_9GAMM|nr:dienelactone hydrolase family protein [Panacagrimonas perspica]TDU31714.1 carboxymethylenebutenolidase [Panacagrimonas perspica]THD03071.1 hypothetical protein B1810_10780 [Panacagrimonas perspica]
MSNTPVVIRPVDIASADGVIDGWWLHPLGAGPWPAVIVHTDIKGVRPAFEETARRLAALGHAVLLPNLYHRALRITDIDPSLSLHDEAQRAQLGKLRESVSTDGTHRDHVALLDWLDHQPEVRGGAIGIVGYCMSGAIALRTAADFPDRVVAAASFHGGRLASDDADGPHLRASAIRARLVLGYARQDKSMPDERIAQLEAALTSAGVAFTSDHHDALHGFAVSDKPEYSAAATELHWKRLQDLFAATLGAAR